MPTDDVLLDVEDRMEKAIVHLKKELTGIRTGRANPGLVESVKIIAYGTEMTLKQLATIACPESTQILIRPHDASTLKDIEKGIVNSDLGYAPNNDGKNIRLNIPPLSTEVRQRMVKRIRDICEACKVAIRRVRQDGNKQIDSLEKEKQISEDERDSAKSQIQDFTKQYEESATKLATTRESEVMDQ
ncbi:MAG: ribosome recycling factor [Thermoguttaceae bacterium]|nr:ribosome recycling factor [Thermoguttaceae bacterium]